MEKLKTLRIKHNLSYAQFAKELGISKTYYWQIENKTRGLSYIMAIKIADILKTTPDEIFYDELKNKTV